MTTTNTTMKIEKTLCLVMPHDDVKEAVLDSLKKFGHGWVCAANDPERCFFITCEAYDEAIAPYFVNMLDVDDDSDEYDLLASTFGVTEKSLNHDALLALC